MGYFGTYFGISQSNTDTPSETPPVAPVLYPCGLLTGDCYFYRRVKVSIVSPDGAAMLYTLNDTVPVLNGPDSSIFRYEGPFTINENTVVTAVAVNAGLCSEVSRVTYLRTTKPAG